MNPLVLKHCFGLYTSVYIQQQWILNLKLKQCLIIVDLVDAPDPDRGNPSQDQIQDQTTGLIPEEEEEEAEKSKGEEGVLYHKI